MGRCSQSTDSRLVSVSWVCPSPISWSRAFSAWLPKPFGVVAESVFLFGACTATLLVLKINGQFRNGFGEFVGGVPPVRGDFVGDQAYGQVGVEDFPVVRFVGIVDEIAVDVLDDLLELVVIL